MSLKFLPQHPYLIFVGIKRGDRGWINEMQAVVGRYGSVRETIKKYLSRDDDLKTAAILAEKVANEKAKVFLFHQKIIGFVYKI